jgi:hypothetical protein
MWRVRGNSEFTRVAIDIRAKKIFVVARFEPATRPSGCTRSLVRTMASRLATGTTARTTAADARMPEEIQ